MSLCGQAGKARDDVLADSDTGLPASRRLRARWPSILARPPLSPGHFADRHRVGRRGLHPRAACTAPRARCRISGRETRRSTRRSMAMERKKASDFPPEVLKLFDGYIHGMIGRREFLDRAGEVCGRRLHRRGDAGKPHAQLRAGAAGRQGRRPNQDRVSDVPVAAGLGHDARISCSAGERRRQVPGVVVYHENRGLNPYIEDVARRLAVENFVAFAPDALTPVGGYPGDEEKAAQLFAQLDAEETDRGPDRRRRVSQVAPRMHGKDRRRGLLLRRRHRQHAGRADARSRARRCRFTASSPAPPTRPGSRRRC